MDIIYSIMQHKDGMETCLLNTLTVFIWKFL